MKYRCPACRGELNRDGRIGKTIKSFCEIKHKNVVLRRVTKKAKVKQ